MLRTRGDDHDVAFRLTEQMDVPFQRRTRTGDDRRSPGQPVPQGRNAGITHGTVHILKKVIEPLYVEQTPRYNVGPRG